MTTPSTTGATCFPLVRDEVARREQPASAPAVTAAPVLTPAEGTGLFES